MAAPGIKCFTKESVAPQLTTELQVGGEELIHGIADRWRSLCEETGSAPFQRPEWVQTYLRAFEPDNKLVLLTVYSAEELVAVLPVVRKRCTYACVPVVKLAGAANVHSVRFEIVRKKGIVGEAALGSIWQLLRSMPGWDILEFPVFPQHGGCQQLLALASRDGFNTVSFLAQDSPILHMQRDGNGRLTWLGDTTRHFRHELRRFGRLLEKETGDKPKLTCHVEPHAETLDKFYEMEAAGWKGVEGSAIDCDKTTRSFYDSIAREATSGGYFRLHALEANGRMTAGAFSVVTDGCFFPMKITYDESLRRGAPGLLLLNGILQECAENGIGELFFGGGNDSYKTAWTPETLPHFNGFVFNKSLRAQLAFQVRTKLLSRLGKYLRPILENWRTVMSHGFGHGAAKSTDKNHRQARISLTKPGSLEVEHKKEKYPMQMSMICCPFKTSFGFYASSLKAEIEKKTGTTMQWVASNCGCGDPIEVARQFQAKQCDYFNMPMPVEFRSKKAWKRRLRGAARSVITYARAKKYAALSKNAEVVHFQQILNAYGSKAVFHWLHQPSNAIRVITVHELDGDQQEFPETNTTYNLADAVIVHCEDMKQQLVRLKVQESKVHVVLHGTDMPEVLPDSERSGIVFYGGHKLMSGKGIETVFKAMAIVKARMGKDTPTLKIHGHYGPVTPKEGAQLALDNDIADKVIWLNQISEEDMVRLYQSSRVCVLPYTGSFAGLPASLAAACKLPVVCTRKAGLPDHLGDSGVWVDENSPEQLAERIIELLTNDSLRQQVGAKLLKRAKESLSWDVIAEKTLEIYQQSTAKKALAKAS